MYLDELFGAFSVIADGGNYRKKLEERGEILNTKIDRYTIDSCSTLDCGYETAIITDENIVIVERYSSKEEMAVGHKKWCEFCKKNPTEVYSIQNFEMEEI